MKLDFFKCIDILMVAFVVIGLVVYATVTHPQPTWAQPAGKLSGTPQEKAAQAAKADQFQLQKACEDHALKVQRAKKASPARVTPYPVAYKKCMELRAK